MSERKHTNETDVAYLKATSLNIRERLECDTVHIFITRHNFRKDETETSDAGVGNVLARKKQIEEYLLEQNRWDDIDD